MKRRLVASVIAMSMLIATGVVAASAGGDSVSGARAELGGAGGESLGEVRLIERDGKIVVKAKVNGIPAGFHGFHVHAVGACEGPAFTSAGGHLSPAGASHPSHAGDMPVLLVNGDGTARAAFSTDRFTLADLFDRDGSAIIVHANPDNYANIPTDRYDPDPDAMTLATGDAGGRIACGVVKSS